MRVNVKVDGLQFVVPCGQGLQSCRWLGLVAAQRHALTAPHGRCRTREDAHHKQGFFLPAAVMKLNGQLLSPEQRVVDVCKDNEILTVRLQQTVSVDEIGTPQFTEWTVDAFFPSQKRENTPDCTQATKADSEMTIRAVSTPKATTSEQKVEKDGVSSFSDEFTRYAHAEMLRQVSAGQFLSDVEVEAAFRYDWGRLHLDEIEKDARERDLVQEILLSCFHTLNAGYMHYATGSSELTYGMSGAEFAHFLHECDLARLHDIGAQKMVRKILVQCLRQDSLAAIRNQGTLSRVGYLHALLRIVQVSFCQNGCYSEVLDRILKTHLLPTITRLTSGPFRDHLHHDKMVATIQEAKPKLVKVYTKYALDYAPAKLRPSSNRLEAADSSVFTPPGYPHSSTWPLLLSVVGLRTMLYDCGVFSSGTVEEQSTLFDRAVEQSFLGMRDERVEDQAVVFSEFLEIIARVALASENTLQPRDTITLALQAVQRLPLK